MRIHFVARILLGKDPNHPQTKAPKIKTINGLSAIQALGVITRIRLSNCSGEDNRARATLRNIFDFGSVSLIINVLSR